jgi:lysozyme
MNRKRMKQQLIQHEGIRLKPYRCPAGKLTIGIGRNLEDKGITVDEAHFLLDNDIFECQTDLIMGGPVPDFFDLPEPIQRVLVDMRFNLGPAGFRSFENMIEAVKRRDWPEMKRQMIESRWYGQVKSRGPNLVEMVEEVIG